MTSSKYCIINSLSHHHHEKQTIFFYYYFYYILLLNIPTIHTVVLLRCVYIVYCPTWLDVIILNMNVCTQCVSFSLLKMKKKMFVDSIWSIVLFTSADDRQATEWHDRQSRRKPGDGREYHMHGMIDQNVDPFYWLILGQ